MAGNTSSLYTASWWARGRSLARRVPRQPLRCFAGGLGRAYALARPGAREIVKENLRPVVSNPAAATNLLFRNFGLKLLDLLRFEAGAPVHSLFSNLRHWEQLEAVHARGKGVLLLTPHLGNWEFGAPLLTSRGIPLKVVSLPEPDPALTLARQQARTRQGIETIVIGEDGFGFINILRELEKSAVIALLVDRPRPDTAVEIDLFGKPFLASVAPAEIARASGCALLPVIIPAVGAKYEPVVLPEIHYDRAALRQSEARRDLAQRIMTSFEPVIRQFATQWYHFVPVWHRSLPQYDLRLPGSPS